MESLKIITLDLENHRQKILDFLLPYETFSLFLIANLKEKEFPAFYYVAYQNEKILGVCGYFPIFKSFSLFTQDPKVSKALAKFVAERHEIETLLGIDASANEALNTLENLGYIVTRNPKYVFMELDIDKKFQFFPCITGTIKSTEEAEYEEVALLHRILHEQKSSSPITDIEKNKIQLSRVKFCLKIKNHVVSCALSNGMGEKAFQILGVVTHPDYRNQNLAKMVCSHLIKHMKTTYNAKKAILFTGYENFAAHACYQALGFEITGEYIFANFRRKS